MDTDIPTRHSLDCYRIGCENVHRQLNIATTSTVGLTSLLQLHPSQNNKCLHELLLCVLVLRWLVCACQVA